MNKFFNTLCVLIVFFCLVVNGCSKTIHPAKQNLFLTCKIGQKITEIYKQRSITKIDYLFIIHNSQSMAFLATEIENNVMGAINQIVRYPYDFHIGIIATDLLNKGCLHGKDKYITSRTPELLLTAKQNLNLVYNGNHSSIGLDTLMAAIDNNSKCNNNFFRDDAFLSVIFISNEDDTSKLPIDKYVQNIRQVKQSEEKIMISFVGRKIKNTCVVKGKYVPIMSRYWYISKKWNGNISELCDNNWGTIMCLDSCSPKYFPPDADFRAIGIRKFILSYPAVPNSVNVIVNNKNAKDYDILSWIYEEREKAIEFQVTYNTTSASNYYPPPPNVEIRIEYMPLCP